MVTKEKININQIAQKLISHFHFITPNENKKLYVYKDGVYNSNGESIAELWLVKTLKSQATKSIRQEIIEQIKILSQKNMQEIKNKNEELICVENGILNIETKELIQHSPDYIFFSKFPVIYNPSSDCPEFKKFLKDALNDADIQTLQEFVGYTLLVNSTKYEKALILHGEGGRGKSTFLKIITALLGRDNVCAFTLQQMQDKVILVELFGKVANISMDIPSEKILNNEHIKSIVSGDRITGRGLFKGPLTFTPTCKLMFSCNVLPEPDLRDGDAFFDRWIYIKFEGLNFRKAMKDGVKMGKPDYDKLIIKQELSGILNWAIDGYHFLKLTEFIDIKGVKKKWLRNSDNVLAYCGDKLIETFEDKDWIVKKDIYKDYRDYCKIKKFVPLKSNSFHMKLQKLIEVEEFNPTINGKQRRAWCGVKFR
jgi:putative DNA primase/helicase